MSKSILSILLSVILLFSCNKKNQQTEAEAPVFSEKVARVVSHVTVGNIKSTQPVEVDFIDDIVDFEALNKDLGNDLIRIEPAIDGQLIWSDRNTLTFRPSKQWELRKRYSVIIDLNKLSSRFRENDIGELKFGFYVEGREIAEFDASPKLRDRNDPRIVEYTGRVVFTEPVDEETVKSSLSLKQGMKSFEVSITSESDGVTFGFKSEDLIRDDKSRTYTFLIDKSNLELSEDHRDDFEIPAIEEMKVTRVSPDETGRHPRIRVTFSDELESTQNLAGLVRIEPETQFTVNRIGSSIVLDGAFKFGESYTLFVDEGVKSRWGTNMKGSFKKHVHFSDLPPRLEFSSDGFILPSSNKQKIQFMTANLKRVHLEIKKVYSNDIDRFVRNEKLNSSKTRGDDFINASYNGATGVILYNETLELGETKNEWLLSEFDCAKLFDDYSSGLYLIQLNFNPRDVLVDVGEDQVDYVHQYGQIYKPVIISDIGLMIKKAGDACFAFTTDLTTGKPMPGVNVELRNYWNESRVVSGVTNSEGMIRMSNYDYFHYAIARKDGHMTLLKSNEMEWNTSGFDISGVSEDRKGLKVFSYTERGVYRPGDDINLSVIVRDNSDSYEDNTPVTLRLYNPQHQRVLLETLNKAEDGFYNFHIRTDESAPTGNWYAYIDAGGRTFTHYLKIETVVPYKLKVRLETDKDKIYAGDDYLNLKIQSNYLFGTPASDLKAEAEIEFVSRSVNFPKFESYSFDDPYSTFTPVTRKLFSGSLDTAGVARINFRIPEFENIPSALTARVSATVFEKGGRPNNGWLYIPVESYPVYVGIKKAEYGYRYIQTNREAEIPLIVLNEQGIPAEGQEIRYRIYQNNSYWWWQYDSHGEYRRRFKTNNNTVLIKEGKLTSGKSAVTMKFKPEERGDYMVEVQVGGFGGHKVSTFMYAYPWGEVPGGDQNEGTLSLRSDKPKYNIGETARIICPMPLKGTALLTVERGNDLIKREWIPADGKGEMVYELPITEAMVPTSYLTVSVIQPHAQSVNDRPIRMFGILPLQVENPETRHGIQISMPGELEPNKKFFIDISTDDGKPTQFTVAVVDEGLLDLTAFKTPDPWKHFFQKLRLQVETFDVFSHVIGANHDDVFRSFSIGGDMDYREAELGAKKGRRRFKPVSMFSGPVKTDANGRASVSFTMPEYYGSVRVMVVSARGNSYAHKEKTVPVRTDLIVQSSVPRVLGPGEKFKLPVSVFTMKDQIGAVSVKVTTEGPLKINGRNTATLNFTKASDKDVFFDVQTSDAVGQARIVVEASSAQKKARTTTDVMVQPRASRVYGAVEKELNKGQTISIDVPKTGLNGTNRARLSISLFPNMDFTKRLAWLIHYPYGCIEQTTSSVMPQLYLKTLIPEELVSEKEIDNNINAGIERLQLFQTSQGGMAYWPGNTDVSEWGTNYAAHFLIMARKEGYYVPDAMYNELLNYMEQKARYASGDLITRVNRVYVLALAGRTSNDRNVLQSKELDKLNDTQLQMLATSFYLTGEKSAGQKIAAKAGRKVEEYNEYAGSYGSYLRDMAIILNCYSLREETENARLTAREIARELSQQRWYSTQTVGYSLLALGNYFRSIGLDNIGDQHFIGTVIFPDGSQKEFDSRKAVTIDAGKAIGGKINVTLDVASSMSKAYTSVSYDGVPLRDKVGETEKNLSLTVNWMDEEGNQVDPTSLTQGTTIYGHYTVNNTSPVSRLEEIALVQIIPSGWEIENIRLSGSSLPEWTSDLKLNREEYLDIRDDRIMWFFDMIQRTRYDFIVKINAVTAGEFYMPPAKVEAMYNNDYLGKTTSMQVLVKQF